MTPYKGYVVSFSSVHSDWHQRGSNYAAKSSDTRICHRTDLRPISPRPIKLVASFWVNDFLQLHFCVILK